MMAMRRPASRLRRSVKPLLNRRQLAALQLVAQGRRNRISHCGYTFQRAR